jgi:hypothetical protein
LDQALYSFSPKATSEGNGGIENEVFLKQMAKIVSPIGQLLR